MIVPGLNANESKWQSVMKQRGGVNVSEELLGLTTVNRDSGAVTTRCARSMGWETPDGIDEESKATLYLTRSAPTPWNKTRDLKDGSQTARLPTGFNNGALRSKAWVNQQASRCPFGSDRRFVGGSYLYRTSYLHKTEIVPDRRYVDLHTRHPITVDKKQDALRVRPTHVLVRLINEKMNERAKCSRMMTRMVDSRHPLRALMGADKTKKAFLTTAELKVVLDHFNIELLDEELESLMDEYPSAIPADEKGFDYLRFVTSLNDLQNAHPLGGFAGNSWGWKT
mmetsp:Transcript_24324/g.57931  ORF Transcript_24324/g.57931 Transcript_24324/m.57931 type:complete len:282 (-) Transcript_24324:347-1192(-)